MVYFVAIDSASRSSENLEVAVSRDCCINTVLNSLPVFLVVLLTRHRFAE